MDSNRKKEPLSFAGILKLLYSNRKSGLLKVQSADGELLIHFKEGKIVGVEMPRGQEWVIGQYLVEGEVISERRLMRALKIASQKGRTPEEVLVEKRWVSPDVLKRYMDLYSREVILPLFGRVGLVCSFLGEEPTVNKWLPPVSVPFLLKEGERRAREWPLLTKRISSPDVVYDKDKSFVSQVIKEGDDTGNPLFSERLDPELGANERIVYYFVNGRRTVKQLARSGGLDLFSTYKALYNLENKFMVKVVDRVGGERAADRTVVPVLVKLFFYAVILAVLGGLGLMRPGPLKLATGERQVDVSTFEQAEQTARWTRLQYALTARYLAGMACPESLAKVGAEEEIPLPDADALEYHCHSGSGFLLLPTKEAH